MFSRLTWCSGPGWWPPGRWFWPPCPWSCWVGPWLRRWLLARRSHFWTWPAGTIAPSCRRGAANCCTSFCISSTPLWTRSRRDYTALCSTWSCYAATRCAIRLPLGRTSICVSSHLAWSRGRLPMFCSRTRRHCWGRRKASDRVIFCDWSAYS